MSDREFEASSALSRLPNVDRSKQDTVPPNPAVQRDVVDQVTCRAGDKSCATAHAAAINRATAARPGRAGSALLQLQKQYGNRYVEQVVARAQEEAQSNAVHPTVERAIQEHRGGGQPLDTGVRRQMESSLGADFSRVRVHAGSHADTLNRALSARAFTTGHDIFFRQGAYQPGSFVGRELLAHELTHVVQQNGDQVRRKMSVSQPGDPHEMEAEQTAHAVMQRELHKGSPGSSAVSRQEEKEETPAMASPSPDGAQRQPEAVNDEDEKKKHHVATKWEGSELARAEDEPAE
jgi:Domain of unknown function (DUF4157)